MGGLILLVLEACGGRSTTDFAIYDEGSGGLVGQGGAQSKGGTPSVGGVSSYGGAYPSVGGAYAYGGAYGYGGAYPGVGGAYAYGGAYGTGGFAGEPNSTVVQACAGFCQPYAKLCPDDGGGVACARDCIQNLRGASAYCRQFSIDVLNCLSSVLYGQMSCEQGVLNAVLFCTAQFGTLECDEAPPPPNCPGYGTASPGYCELYYDCGAGQNYAIQCSGNDEHSMCSCLLNGSYTGIGVEGFGPDPCSNAFNGCGF